MPAVLDHRPHLRIVEDQVGEQDQRAEHHVEAQPIPERRSLDRQVVDQP
jgi:hypothetical protein